MKENLKLPEGFLKLMLKSSEIMNKELDSNTIKSLTNQYNYSLKYIKNNIEDFKINKFLLFFYDVSDDDLNGCGFGLGFGDVINPFSLSDKEESYVVDLVSKADFLPDPENPFSDNFYKTGITDIFLDKQYD